MSRAPASVSQSVPARVVRALQLAEQMPAWAALPVNLGGAALLVALFGLLWDVAYHVDHGRDANLFTPAHVLILLGLGGIGAAAAGSIAVATATRAATGLRVGRLRVPLAALPMAAMALGALAAFPLDDLWHREYGIDVTLWSPTHLVMIGGGALSTFAIVLFPVEADARPGPPAGWRRVVAMGAVLVALSVFQLEFDFGVPQWQALYQPLLIAIAAALGLTAARASLGPGGAFKAALVFLAIRGLLALVVGAALGHTVPRFGLYLGSAAAVEAAFWLLRDRPQLMVALVSGLLVGTFGLAVEWAWSHVWGRMPWTPSMLPRMWVPALAALAAAVVGTAMGRVLAGRRTGIHPAAVPLSLLGLAVLLAVPLPRSGAPGVTGHLVTTVAGPARPIVDRYGVPGAEQDVNVEITLTPPDAARNADWFEVLAWQGGGQRGVPLIEESSGRYRSAAPVPTGGSWKAQVYLARGDELVAMPVAMPPDPAAGTPGVALAPVRDGPLVPARDLLTSEAHPGPPWVAAVAYSVLIALALLWVAVLVVVYRRVGAAARATPRAARPGGVGPPEAERAAPGAGREAMASRPSGRAG